MDRSPLTGFVALLRAAGQDVGPERVLLAHQAVALTGLTARGALHAALRATLCCDAAALPLFDAAFALYWRDPGARLQDLLPALPPEALLRPRKPPQAGPPRRLMEAIAPPHAWRPAGELPPAQLGASAAEAGPATALDEAAAQELRQARERARRLLTLLPPPAPSRRWQARARGALDLAAALRRLQSGRPLLPLPQRRRTPLQPQFLWLLDASGSMQDQLQALLLWAHAQAQHAGAAQRWRFWAFSGERLQALTPLLRRHADPDAALRALGDAALRSGGGTRLASALRQLLQQEGPRLGAGPCTLLLVSDGLDHEPDDPALAPLLAAWRQRGVRLLWVDPLQDREHLGASAAALATLPRLSL